MADTLCGPSNPLQNFQKHAAVDRSLQHDRLAPRQGQAQGFHTVYDANAGLLDPEFEAFEAGASLGGPDAHPASSHFQQDPRYFPDQRPSQHPLQPHQPTLSTFERHEIQPSSSSWATDFQQRHLIPSLVSQSSQQHQTARPSRRGWHEEFQSHHQPSHTPYQPRSQYYAPPNRLLHSSYMTAPRDYSQSTEARWKGKGRWQAGTAQDTAAFEREFEALSTQEHDCASLHTAEGRQAKAKVSEVRFAEPDVSTLDRRVHHHMEAESKRRAKMAAVREQEDHISGDNMLLNDEWLGKQPSLPDAEVTQVPYPEAEQQLAEQQLAEQQLAGQQPAEQQMASQPANDEEMRATARLVVEHIQDETSEKFRNSEFFALMRQIRDGEKQVKEDEIVSVDSPSVETKTVPWAQSDADLGRSYRMAGALSPSDIDTDAGKLDPLIPPP